MKAIDLAERDIGMPPSVHAAFAGTAQAFSASLASQPTLLMIALITVYIVLGVLYESYVHPITILSTIRPQASAPCSRCSSSRRSST